LSRLASGRQVSGKSILMVALLCWLPCAAFAAGLQEYSARYSLYRNGKLAGKADFKLERQGEKWVFSTKGSGTHGLARVLRARDREYVEGVLDNGRFRPLRFEHEVTVAGIGSEWSALFDWPKDTVTVLQDNKTIELGLQGQALDGLSLKLEMQRLLRDGQVGSEGKLQFLLLDEDQVKQQTFRVLPGEMLETSLGCLETIPVERIRSATSTRFTRAWHAPALDYLTVRLEHGKTDGDQMEMRIAELQQAGQAVVPGTGCTGRQSG
jgi:hypothetical protein